MRLSSSRSTAILHRPQQDFPLWDRAGTRPSLDQQFADRKDLIDTISGQQLITHTRASAGTYRGSDGLIKTATTNEARFDHDPVTGESLGLLVEESRTNLLTYSEEFDNPAWGKFQATVTANTTTAPDGSSNADSLIESAITGTHVTFQDVSTSASVTQTFSVYAKANQRSRFQLFVSDTGANAISGVFNLSTGAVISATNAGTGSGATASVISVGNGWYRCVLTGVPASSGVTVRAHCYVLDNSSNQSYTGDGTSGIYLWGAQLEAGSFPTSYIATTSSTVTRAADVVTDTSTGANIRTLYAEFRSPGLGTRPIVSLDDDTANERIELLTSGTDPKLLVTDGGSAVADIDAGTVTANTLAKLAARFATDDYAAAVDGGTLQTDTSGTLPTVDRIRIGSNQAGDYFTGTIARFTGWDEELPDTAVEGITQ